MSNFKGPYLRVLTPRTSNGKDLIYDKQLRIKYKESHFELSARASLEKENLTRPHQLRHIIQTVGLEPEQVIVDEATPFTPRPQRVKRVEPQPDDIVVISHKEEVKEIKPKKEKPVKKEEKKKRTRRTREQIEQAKQQVQ